jgi:hypothetical protein
MPLGSGREAADFQRLGWAPTGVAGLNGGLLLFRTFRSLMAAGTTLSATQQGCELAYM